jgi:hypothetical protein
MTTPAARTAYNDFLYPSYPLPNTHPDHLVTVATLLGLRPAPAVITAKTNKEPRVTRQQPTGIRTNFWMPTRIPLAECYLFIIRLEAMPVHAIFSLNTTAAEPFNVGQRVAIEYEERGIPLNWKRVYVQDMKPA